MVLTILGFDVADFDYCASALFQVHRSAVNLVRVSGDNDRIWLLTDVSVGDAYPLDFVVHDVFLVVINFDHVTIITYRFQKYTLIFQNVILYNT